MKRIGVLLATVLCLCGCKAQTEPEQREYVLGMSIEKLGTGVYSIYAECADTDEEKGQRIYNGTGISIDNALKNIDMQCGNSLYLGNSSLIIVDNELFSGRAFAEALAEYAAENYSINLNTVILACEDIESLYEGENSVTDFAVDYYKNIDEAVTVGELIAAVNTERSRDIPMIRAEGSSFVIEGAVSIDESSMI